MNKRGKWIWDEKEDRLVESVLPVKVEVVKVETKEEKKLYTGQYL